MTPTSSQPIYLVIGPHRSGTSVLTRVLSLMGLDLGQSLMPPSFDNPRGFWENEKIVETHEALLNAFGKDWTSAAQIPEDWAASKHAHKAVNTLKSLLKTDFQSNKPSLIKDPRLCILHPLWTQIAQDLGRPLHFINVTRTPSAVRKSLQVRNKFSTAEANYIVLSYLQAQAQQKGPGRSKVVCYEQLTQLPAKKVVEFLVQSAALPISPEDENLVKSVEHTIVAPKTVKTARAKSDKAYSARIKKNSLTIEFPAFKSLVNTYASNLNFENLEKKFANRDTFLSADAVQIATYTQNLQDLEDKIAALKGGIEERDKRIRKLVDAEGTLKGGIEERNIRIRKLVDAEGTLKGGIQERDKRIRKLVDAEGALKGGITERDETIRALRAKSDTDALKAKLDISRLQTLETQLRTQIDGLSNRIDSLNMQLHYHRSKPVVAAIKSVAFRSLRLAKRLTPLPASVKTGIARKFTPLAQRLQGPIQQNAPLIDDHPHMQIDTQAIDFGFGAPENPVISVIIPVYNEIAQTIACLKSVHAQFCSVPFEVLIADDASSDPFHEVLSRIAGVRVFRNPENLGFLQNCNTNAKHAKGDYIVFLNNDTLVNPGWLENLYQTFVTEKNVGVVGSKLLFPDGRLQEAGGIIWEDASGWNWGRGENADHPRYNFLRDVDYVSGASFMVKRDIFERTGGFSNTLEKAYYEDTDYCFRMRDMGYRVLYQPLSSLVHIEGLSSGTDVTAGAKRYQEINKAHFYETWKHVLKNHLPNGQTPHIASDRKAKGHILYIDATTPEISSDSGSVDAFNAMRILTDLGYRVHFAPGTNFAYWGEHTKALQAMGVECVYHPFYPNLETFIKDRGDSFDFVILARAEINDLFLSTIKKQLKSAKIINYTVDLHYLRMEREAALITSNAAREDALQAAKDMKAKELSFMKKSDGTIVLSAYEREILAKYKALGSKLYTIPLIREAGTSGPAFSKRKDIVFIGGYRHPPNIDAVEWLANEIWPEMAPALPGVNLIICGAHMPNRFKEYESDNVKILGRVEDVTTMMHGCRLSIAPLRYGAGLKGKVASSFGAATPCIGTDIAFEGMAKDDGFDDIALCANTPEDFAALAKDIYFDQDKWENASRAALKYHDDHYALASVRKLFETMLHDLSRS